MTEEITSQMLAKLLNMKREDGSLPQRMKRDIKHNDNKDLQIILIKDDGDGNVQGDVQGRVQGDVQVQDDGIENPFKESLLSSDLPSELLPMMPMIYQEKKKEKEPEMMLEQEKEPEMMSMIYKQPEYDFINQQKELINQQQELIKQQQEKLKECSVAFIPAPAYAPTSIIPTLAPTFIKKKKTVRWKEMDGLMDLIPKKKSRRMLRRRKLIRTRKATPFPIQPFSSNILKL